MDVLQRYGTAVYAGGKVLAATDDGIGLITFNQPEKRNAMSLEMWQGFARILDAFDADDAVRVVVLTGAGPKAFVSGADISQFADQHSGADAQRDYERETGNGRDRMAAFSKPIIARIRGFCLGGGLSIALGADVRIAALDSEFGLPASRLGIAYAYDTVRRLVALVGPAHARTLLYTGSRITAVEAERIGLINRVVPDADLSDHVVELARTIADNAPMSVAAAKRAVETAMVDGNRDPVDAAVMACFDSADCHEGRTAFLEKRPPRFTGS